MKILAGDFKEGNYEVFLGKATHAPMFGELVEIELKGNIESLELVTEENKKKIAGTVGAGAIGGLLLGPLGVIGGMLVGGKKKEVTFVCVLKDGKKFLGVAKNDTFKKLLAWSF